VSLVERAKAGDRDALTELVSENKRWIYNIALRMLWDPTEAEDATQDILLKMLSRLSSFEHRSRLRTWLYRLTVNHLLNMKRGSMEQPMSFDDYAAGLESASDADLTEFPESERALLVEEAKIGCMTGMLLCLSREQRIAYVLGSMFALDHKLCAELLGIEAAAFRKRLSRARADLHHFMQGKCGLLEPANPCRCKRKTKAFIERGFIDPSDLKFKRGVTEEIRDVAHREASDVFRAVTEDYPRLFRQHPFAKGPELRGLLSGILDGSALAGSID